LLKAFSTSVAKLIIGVTAFRNSSPTGATYGKFVVQLATHDKLISDTTITNFGLGEVAVDTIYDAPDLDGGTI